MRTLTRLSGKLARRAKKTPYPRRATPQPPEKPIIADGPALQKFECRHPNSAPSIGRGPRGDEDAGHALVERLYPTIVRSVRGRLPRRTSEEDLVQAVFAKIFSKLDQFSGLVPLEHWVSRIAINTCINQLKYESIRSELRWADLSKEEEAVVERFASTEGNLPGDRKHAARELLEQLLDRLKPDERLVITLLHLEERSTEEISRITGWSISRVKVKAFRTRRKMRRLWKMSLQGQR